MWRHTLYLIYGLIVLGMAAYGNIRGLHPLTEWGSGGEWNPSGNRPAGAGVWHK